MTMKKWKRSKTIIFLKWIYTSRNWNKKAVEVEDLDVEGLKANQEEEDGELFDQEEN